MYVSVFGVIFHAVIYTCTLLNLGSVFPVTGPSYLTDLLDHATDREQRSAYPWRNAYRNEDAKVLSIVKNRKPKILALDTDLCGKGRARFPILMAMLNLLTFVSPSRKEKEEKSCWVCYIVHAN